MKIELDENIGRRGLELLTLAGHDVMTVRDRNLEGAQDETLCDVCAREGMSPRGTKSTTRGAHRRNGRLICACSTRSIQASATDG
jgi:hypothetical protein